MYIAVKVPSEGFLIKVTPMNLTEVLLVFQDTTPFTTRYKDNILCFEPSFDRRAELEIIMDGDPRLNDNKMDSFASTVKELSERNSKVWMEKYELEKKNKVLQTQVEELTAKLDTIQQKVTEQLGTTVTEIFES